MIENVLKAENWDSIKFNNPHVSDKCSIPIYKKGDVVWRLLDKGSMCSLLVDRYSFQKVVISYGEPVDDYNHGWLYKIDTIKNFNKDCDYSDLDFVYDEEPQIYLFNKLKDLKQFTKGKVNNKIDKLKNQLEYIEEFKDVKEHREEQINDLIK